MNAGKEQSWDANASGLRQVYALVLKPLDDKIGTRAVEYAVLHEEWRPSPARIRQLAAQLASPLPNEGDCFAQFWEAVRYSHDDPQWFHPIIADVVRRLGGWESFRTLHPHYSDVDLRSIWFARFMDAWPVCSAEWTENVGQQLSLPADARDPKYLIGEPVAVLPVPDLALKRAIQPRAALRLLPPAGMLTFGDNGPVVNPEAPKRNRSLSPADREWLTEEAKRIAALPVLTKEEADARIRELVGRKGML
jgi:hypothetical protein